MENCCLSMFFVRVCCAEITEDSSMLAVGFNDSIIKVFTLVPQKLKTMKSADKLQEVNIEAEDVLVGALRSPKKIICIIYDVI